MQCSGPICILCLRDCDSSGSLSSCNHFFCARCVPRLPPANAPSTLPQCPICKKPYRLVSINAAAVQPLLQDPNNIFKILANRQQQQSQILLRMREALRILKEEVKSTERKYREKSAMLDRVLHHQRQLQLQQQQQQQLQQQLPMQPYQQASTPRGQPCTASAFGYGSGSLSRCFNNGNGSAGRAGSLSFGSPVGVCRQPSAPEPQPQPHVTASVPLPRMAAAGLHHQAATPAAAALAPLGWSATSGVFLSLPPRHSGGDDSGLSASGPGAATAGQVASAAAAEGGGGKVDTRNTASRAPHEFSSFRLSTPLNRSTATPDLLWPR